MTIISVLPLLCDWLWTQVGRFLLNFLSHAHSSFSRNNSRVPAEGREKEESSENSRTFRSCLCRRSGSRRDRKRDLGPVEPLKVETDVLRQQLLCSSLFRSARRCSWLHHGAPCGNFCLPTVWDRFSAANGSSPDL